MTRPNVLVLIADDHRYSSLAQTREPAIHTPHLDRLVQEGTCFDRVYTMGGLTGAVCVPSRACLMTGVNTFDAVVGRTVDAALELQTLRPRQPLLPQVFREAGYRTFITGKWHNDKASLNRGFAQGHDIFLGGMADHFATPVHTYDPTGLYPPASASRAPGHSTDVFADTAIRFLRNYHDPEPFFLYVAFTAPHDPRTPPAAYAERYDAHDRVFDLPPNAFPEHPFTTGDLDIRDELLAPFPRTEAEIRRHLADYYGMITHMDRRVGDILAELDTQQLTAQTIVLYLSDHGLALGQHGLMGKQNLYDHSLHIPCLLRGPGIPAGARVSRLYQHMDVFPTLCALADVIPPAGLEGLSMLETCTEDPNDGERCVLAAYKLFQRCIMYGDLKLIHHYEETEGTWHLAYEQLFDLQDDPFEICNLAYDPRQQANIHVLRDRMREVQMRYHDPLLSVTA